MANYVLTPAAVRKLNRLVRNNSGNSGAENYPSPVSLDEFVFMNALPFESRPMYVALLSVA